jgi:transposase
MKEYSKYVGLDVHKDSISVAFVDMVRGAPVSYGSIVNTQAAIARLVKKFTKHGEDIGFCYEAGSCGYEIHRQITLLGCDCMVVAPSLIPRRPGDHVKTDRRDAQALARLYRSGDLTSVWVPGDEQEAVRDLVRYRSDMKNNEKHAKQQLSALALRHGHAFQGKTNWSQAHFRWLENLKFPMPVQQIVLQEGIDSVLDLSRRVASLTKEMEKVLETWIFTPVVEGLMAMRGISMITAMTVVAELGDITRFDKPQQLMGFLGLVPSEHSSGCRQRRGGITKAGNQHVRRALIESAWSYRFQARKTTIIQRRASKTSPAVQTIAWNAQKRLCGRYQHYLRNGKLRTQACTAVAREMVGFIWAIACEVMSKMDISAACKSRCA